jgi:hypothetical protein
MSTSGNSAFCGKADWRRVKQLYQQFSAIANDPEQKNLVPDTLMSSLAEALGRVLAHYDGCEVPFLEELLHMWSEAENLLGTRSERFRDLYYDKRLDRFTPYHPPGTDRRRPKPFEASVETVRRLRDLNGVRDALESAPSSAILGGSLSYGRFYNVSGAFPGQSSDTDLLLVIADYGQLKELPRRLSGCGGLNGESLRDFEHRVEIFEREKEHWPRCVFSHKLKFWDPDTDPVLSETQIPGRYVLSFHVFSWDLFEYIILRDISMFEPEGNGQFVRHIHDYRNTKPRTHDNQRSFSGIDSSVLLKYDEVDGGYLGEIRVCHIEADRFFPGLHQNLILPQFEIRWEVPSLRLYLPLLSFRWKLLERLHEERRLRPFELQELSLSHTRKFVFSPHVVRRADRE